MKKIVLLILLSILATAAFADDKPANHNKLWEYTHGMKAKQDMSGCLACHVNEKTCLDCHKATFNGKTKPRSHNGLFPLNHRLDAKRDASTCTTCHEKGGDFCLKCHQKLNKAPSSSAPVSPQSHKASNWRTSLHGAYAKRNLSSCQVCHPDLYTVSPCTLCHGGSTNIAGSPHPAGFSSSPFKDKTVCYKCHGTTTAGPAAGPLP